MNRRMKGWLLSLYPRRWRDRYGPEVGNLTDELIDAGETTPLRAGFDLTFSAATERGRALGERWRALGRRRVLAMATAFAMLLVLGFALSGHQVMRGGSTAMTVACKANFIGVQGQPERKLVVGRILRVQAQTNGQGRQWQVVEAVAGTCGPAGLGCLSPVPMPPNLHVIPVPKPGALRVGQVIHPPGKQWTVDVPAMARHCAMSVHAKDWRSSVRTKPGPPPAPGKKQVPSKKT
jgi:hypothetical protein